MDFCFGVASFTLIRTFTAHYALYGGFHQLYDSDPFGTRLHIEIAFASYCFHIIGIQRFPIPFLCILGSEGFFSLRCSASLSCDYFTA